MWKKPYSFKEGTAIALGLMLTGVMLQLSMGPLNWDIFMWPANIIALAVFVLALVGLHLLRHRCYFVRFMTTAKAAVPPLIGALALTLIMGLTKQMGEKNAPADPLAFSKMLESWPFILTYIWLTAIVGEEVLVQARHLSRHNIPVLSSHLGLFIVLTCGTLGSADMQRLKMFCEQGKPEWRALDAWNNVHELPLAIELEKFSIDEYPPKLMIIDNAGKPLPREKPAIMEVGKGVKGGRLLNWDVSIVKHIDNAMPMALARMAGGMPKEMAGRIRMDSLGQALNKEGYVATSLSGSECALLIKAQRLGTQGKETAKGWVTCGSYQFNYQSLALDATHSLVMAAREPSRYYSQVTVYTKDGKAINAEIEVNHPLSINGWKVYQLSYDEQMGKWSTLSVLELVRDPWLPVVYLGILLLAIGAVGMFFCQSKTRADESSKARKE